MQVWMSLKGHGTVVNMLALYLNDLCFLPPNFYSFES